MIRKTTNKDLTTYNTFRMKVKCRSFIEYDSVADLIDIDFGTRKFDTLKSQKS